MAIDQTIDHNIQDKTHSTTGPHGEKMWIGNFGCEIGSGMAQNTAEFRSPAPTSLPYGRHSHFKILTLSVKTRIDQPGRPTTTATILFNKLINL